MHHSALNFGKLFFETYCGGLQGAIVHDVGAQNVNGSLRDVLPPHLGYVGIDFVAGNGVDIVLEDPYRLPFADGSVDVLVCSSCFEHSQFFWVVFLEMLRVLKPQGLLYLNVPSNGSIHRYPVDCWRFYPDAGGALQAWGGHNGYAPQLLESFVGERSPDSYESGGAWHDFVAVFVKEARHAGAFGARMLDALPAYSNGYDSRSGQESRPAFISPDHAELVASGQRIVALENANGQLARSGEELRAQLAAADRQLQQLRSASEARVVMARVRLDQLLDSPWWKLIAPVRSLADWLSGTSRAGQRSRSEIDAEVAAIRASGMFDESYYRSQYPDLAGVEDPIRHYCEHGWREHRSPAPGFDTGFYLESSPEIREAGTNPFLHYVTAGILELRPTQAGDRQQQAGVAARAQAPALARGPTAASPGS